MLAIIFNLFLSEGDFMLDPEKCQSKGDPYTKPNRQIDEEKLNKEYKNFLKIKRVFQRGKTGNN